MWIIFSLLSAAFNGGKSVYDKHLLNGGAIHPFMIGLITFTIAVIITAPIALYLGEYTALYNKDFLWATGGNVILNITATLLYFKILSKHDASLVTGIQSIEPLFVTLTAFLMIGETISMAGAAGIGTIVMGSFMLQQSRSKECRDTTFWQSPWLLMLIYMSITSSATAFSKIAVTEGGAFIYIAARYTAIAAAFAVLAYYRQRKADKPYKFKLAHIGSGFLLTGYVIFEMLALGMAKVAYVESLRRFAIFFSLLFETYFLRYQWNIKRLAACLILFIGAGMIVVIA